MPLHAPLTCPEPRRPAPRQPGTTAARRAARTPGEGEEGRRPARPAASLTGETPGGLNHRLDALRLCDTARRATARARAALRTPHVSRAAAARPAPTGNNGGTARGAHAGRGGGGGRGQSSATSCVAHRRDTSRIEPPTRCSEALRYSPSRRGNTSAGVTTASPANRPPSPAPDPTHSRLRSRYHQATPTPTTGPTTNIKAMTGRTCATSYVHLQ